MYYIYIRYIYIYIYKSHEKCVSENSFNQE